MSNTLGEIPNISLFELLSEEATIFVNTGEKERSIVNETPFGLPPYYYHQKSTGEHF